MDDFEKYLNKQLENPNFKKEWDESQLEYDIMKILATAHCKATKKKHLTIKERFANYTDKPQSGEYDWGEPQGKEIYQ